MATRRNKKRRRGSAPESPEQMVSRVVTAFLHWMDDHPSTVLPTHELLIQVTTLANAKALFGVPNPADWPAETIDELFEVLAEQPRVNPEDIARHGVPALTVFFDFLVRTGRWKPQNDEPASRAALERARRAALRAPDPGGSVIRLPAQWSDRLPDDDRDDSGLFDRLDDLNDPDDIDDEMDDFDDFDDFDSLDPEALAAAASQFVEATGLQPGVVVPITVPPADQEWAALTATPFLRHLRSLTAWVARGRRLDKELVLTPDDQLWWARHHELSIADSDFREVFEMLTLMKAWDVAVTADLITIKGRRAVRGPRADLLDGQASTAAVALGRELVELLTTAIMLPGDEPEPIDVAAYMAMLPILVALCTSDGQDLAALPPEPAPDELDHWESAEQEASALLSTVVFDTLRMLHSFGIVPAVEGRVAIPDGLRPAVVAAINTPSAPFRIDLDPDAVPLPEPEPED